VENGRMVSVKW